MTAEITVDHLPQLARRRGRTRRRKALPEEAVVPDLGAIVVQALVALVFGGLDHLDQRGAFEPFFAQHAIGLVDISLVVLAMVIVEGFGRHVRHERILGEG